MKSTGKQITLTDRRYNWQDVPVMRNGKPTKRTKRVLVTEDIQVTASSYLIEGHEVYIKDAELKEVLAGTAFTDRVFLYRGDGSAVIAHCRYGRTGTADHKQVVEYVPKKEIIFISSTGYNGPCGCGWGASVRRIDW